MKVVFSQHAKERLKQRKISQNQVRLALSDPDAKIISFRQRQLFQLRFDGKMLEVVTVCEKQTLLVITAYFL